jgi:uncharacterized protein YcbK (DUF882 family)
MGDLTKYFSRSEFACKCGCGLDTVDIDTIAILEEVREHFDKPVTITSACRCVKHNNAVGGAVNSQHVKARAADIQVKGVSPIEVAMFVETLIPNSGGIGIYSTFTHVDSRSNKARWGG